MKTVAQGFYQDPRIQQAKELLRDAIIDHQKNITGVKPADPALKEEYLATLKKFGEQRGVAACLVDQAGEVQLLRLHAPARVPPVRDQHPRRHDGQRDHQPEQAAADDAQRGTVGLCTHHQTAPDQRHRHSRPEAVRR
mgnify:CR=1 FL=1